MCCTKVVIRGTEKGHNRSGARVSFSAEQIRTLGVGTNQQNARAYNATMKHDPVKVVLLELGLEGKHDARVSCNSRNLECICTAAGLFVLCQEGAPVLHLFTSWVNSSHLKIKCMFQHSGFILILGSCFFPGRPTSTSTKMQKSV